MKIAVLAHEIATLLDRAPRDVRILSLDCFDTLLWRNAQAPSDVFADTGLGSIEQRILAEKAARRAQMFETDRREVSIEAIHRRLLPADADAAAIAASVQRELDAEARHCFGFAPVMDLIRAARSRGWEVIIVSDSYLSSAQLRLLIARAAGADIADAIGRVFTSSEIGMSKTEGLFGPVLDALGARPASILHLGDNRHADQAAPDALGIHSAYFVQFDEESAQRFRLEAVAATVIDPAIRRTVPALQPHRPLISLRDQDDPAWKLGYDVIGPLMQAFAAWVREEVALLSAEHGRPVRPLFVMRDGHLPMKLFETLRSDIEPGSVSISRIAAGRAAFVDADAVKAWVIAHAHRHDFDVLAGLLLLERNEAARLTGGRRDQQALAHAAVTPEASAKIVRRSARYAHRLAAHVRRAGVNDGDVMMLVDVGYNGTVQNLVAPMLASHLGATTVGRYFLLRETEPSSLDKRGFFDERHYDRDALTAIGSSIAVIEQVCTVAEGSTVDYQPNGKPIVERARQKGAQSQTRDRIQQAAIAFGDDTASAGGSGAASDDADARRRMAAAILTRLMYFPSPAEVAVFDAFDHDVNLGSESFIKMLDADSAVSSLRQRGLPYAQRAQRIFLPAELQAQGLPLNLSLFGIVRFGLDLREGDFQVGAIRVPVIMANAREHAMIECNAFPTHDGYYTMTIPARSDLTLAIQIGMLCEVVQIDSLHFRDAEEAEEAFMGANPTFPAVMTPDGLDRIADDLHRCSEAAMLVVAPPVQTGAQALTLNLTFRPVVRRKLEAALQKAA